MGAKKDGAEQLFDYNVNIGTRTVLLADEIDTDNTDGVGDEMANYFLKAMHLLEQKNDPIRVILRSMGGCSFAGMAIFDAIASSPCKVTAEVYGSAFSMGAVILQAADERVMQPHALLMLHDGTFAVDEQARTAENWALASRMLRKQMYDIIAERSGKSARYWEKRMCDDYILTPQQALAEGLIDRISDVPKEKVAA